MCYPFPLKKVRRFSIVFDSIYLVIWVKKMIGSILGVCLTMVDLMVPEFDVLMLFLNYLDLDPWLWLFWSSCFLVYFLLINNGPLKCHVSNFPSCCINTSLTLLFSFPRQIHFLLDMWVISLLIFGRSWIDNFYLCVLVHIGNGWGRSNNEIYYHILH